MIIFKNFSITIVVILLTFILSCDNNISDISDISDIADDDSSVFRTKWEIKKGGDSIRLPLVRVGEYDFTVYWGDGTKDEVKSWDDPGATQIYQNPGIYDVRIEGTFIGWSCFNRCYNLIEISNWGNMAFGDTTRQFAECRNLEITAEDAPDLSMTISLREALYNCENLKVNASFNNWDVSNITNMPRMFMSSNFNGDISGWDVSKVTNMSGMFANSFFNSDISNWDVSQVRFMNEMFRASLFNKDISSWDVSSVENMDWMFMHSDFNQDISGWSISSVKSMVKMFEGVTLPTKYYDEMLIKWSKLPPRQWVVLGGGNSKYSAAAEDARNKLINEFDWTIFDGGLKE